MCAGKQIFFLATVFHFVQSWYNGAQLRNNSWRHESAGKRRPKANFVAQYGDLTQRFCGRVHKTVKSDYQLSDICPSVFSHGTTSAPNRKEFHEIEYFWKICRQNWGFIKIWQEWRVLFFTMRNFSDKICTENQNTNFVFIKFFPPKIAPFMRKCGKILQSGEGHRWQFDACALRAGYLRLQTHIHNV